MSEREKCENIKDPYLSLICDCIRIKGWIEHVYFVLLKMKMIEFYSSVRNLTASAERDSHSISLLFVKNANFIPFAM